MGLRKYIENLTSDKVTSDEVDTGSLVIGGRLYDEDPNSPFQGFGASVTHNLGETQSQVIIIPQEAGEGPNSLQVNGDTSSNYDTRFNDDTTTTGQTEWQIGRISDDFEYLHLADLLDRIALGCSTRGARTNLAVGGHNSNLGRNGIDSFTVVDTNGTGRGSSYRVYGRSTDI